MGGQQYKKLRQYAKKFTKERLDDFYDTAIQKNFFKRLFIAGRILFAIERPTKSKKKR